MKIVAKTPRTEMAFSALLDKCGTIFEELGSELGYGKHAVDEQLTNFSRISIRVTWDKGEIDFEPASASDTAEVIREKFIHYVDTQCYGKVEKALRDLVLADAPLTLPEQAPVLPKDAAKN